ncbi:MAG: hypothetical protein LQ342_007205 [Letrouitia transgressa]|nr:MAG: hypothetical protein LQ342_007205 [Letrouitia transgressa]
MEGKSTSAAYVEEVSAKKKPGFGTRVKQHYKKWWWLHLLFFIASTLIIVLCVVYVGFPRIAQDGVNDSTLEIQNLTLSNPTSNSFHLEQTALLTNNDQYHPRLDAFNASLAVEGGDPYAYIQLPAIHATKTATSYVNQEVQVTNLDAFADYVNQLLTRETVNAVVKGRTDLHEMRLPTTNVRYEKTVTMNGLNGLSGFKILDFDIKLLPESDGANMLGTVLIPNPTVMTIAMGNVTFSNYVAGDFIGTTALQDLVLRPGDNSVPMRSTIDQTLVIKKVVADYRDGMLPVDIRGNSSVYAGEHLEYFEKALAGNEQHVVLDVGEKLNALGGGGLLSSSPPS